MIRRYRCCSLDVSVPSKADYGATCGMTGMQVSTLRRRCGSVIPRTAKRNGQQNICKDMKAFCKRMAIKVTKKKGTSGSGGSATRTVETTTDHRQITSAEEAAIGASDILCVGTVGGACALCERWSYRDRQQSD